MPRKGPWIAAVVVIVSNVYTLGNAGFNRKGDSEAVMELTERELRLAPREAENTAMALRLAWTDPANGRESGWFDSAKLAGIGFDCRLPVTAGNAVHYRAVPPRATYAALEYEGDAWQRYVAGLATSEERESAVRLPRLVLIDVGNDARVLRALHPDRRRTVIVPAVASLAFVQNGPRPPFLKGRVTSVYPAELNVPRGLRPGLESMPARALTAFDDRFGRSGQALAGEPRYRVIVKWGRSLEPWIENVQVMDGKR
jgi:hypothetical protein